MKKDTYIAVIRQSVLHIPSDCISQTFLSLLADIRYWNKRMNNELSRLLPHNHFKQLDKDNGTDHFEKANLYAEQIKEDCKEAGINVNFFKLGESRGKYANYYFKGKDITTLINI